MSETVKITKLVHGGQGLGELPSGQKVFVWNALPGETVNVRIIKKKRSYAEAVAEEVIDPSDERTAPRENNYLATSPWQIVKFEAENRYKKEIVTELFAQERVALPKVGGTVCDEREWQYRSKMEYSFWGDDAGLHLALHERGSHGKQIVTGSMLAMPAVDAAAKSVCAQLGRLEARASDLKTIIVRSSQKSEAVGALFTKLEKFNRLELPAELKGLRVYHSNPKSPASVPTKLLYELGDCKLVDELLGKPFIYDVDSFFQVNLPVFERALRRIKEYCQGNSVDMYAGVGSIGLSVAESRVTLVELDPATAAMARLNAASSDFKAEVVEASSEDSINCIKGNKPVIFDPPRAGLHTKVVERCLEVEPPQIIYLSCNPATQARDLAVLQAKYKIVFFEIYNFFPHTPHIETLAILVRK